MAKKILAANFTIDGMPVTGLHPTVTIYELDNATPTNNPEIVSGDTDVTEVGGGWYRYTFASYDSTNSYVFSFDGGTTLPPLARWQHGAADNNPGDVWEENAMSHLNTGTTGLVLTQTKADTTNILTSALPNIQTSISNIPANVRVELNNELTHLLSLQNGLTSSQAIMLVEIYTMYGLDPTKPLVVDLTNQYHGSRTFGTVLQDIEVDGNKTTVTRHP